MNNKSCVLLVALLFISFNCLSQQQKISKFKIVTEIQELVMGNGCDAVISQDSIIATAYTDPLTSDTYRKALSKSERAIIIKALSKINMDTLKKEYVNHNIADDAGEFYFTFTIDGKVSKCHIYAVKIEPLLDLFDQINLMIPHKYALYYDHPFFKWLK